MNHVYIMHRQKPNDHLKKKKTLKNPKISQAWKFHKFWKIYAWNVCNFIKKKRVKESYLICRRKPLKFYLKKDKFFFLRWDWEESKKRREYDKKLSVKLLKIRNFQILISQEQLSSNWKGVLRICNWLKSNRIGIERDRDFWPKNWTFSIGQGSTLIDWTN